MTTKSKNKRKIHPNSLKNLKRHTFTDEERKKGVENSLKARRLERTLSENLGKALDVETIKTVTKLRSEGMHDEADYLEQVGILSHTIVSMLSKNYTEVRAGRQRLSKDAIAIDRHLLEVYKIIAKDLCVDEKKATDGQNIVINVQDISSDDFTR